MSINNKYNLIIYNNFHGINLSENIKNSIFTTNNNNLTDYSIIISLESLPVDNTSYITLNMNDSTNFYLFPFSNANIEFNVGDILQIQDNDAIFIITNHVENNKFQLKLVSNSGSSYDMYNGSIAILYNSLFENYDISINSNKDLITNQKDNYTDYLNSSTTTLMNHFVNNVSMISDFTTDYTFAYDFSSPDVTFKNLLDRMYLNVWVYDYNDFKYIYKNDIINNVDDGNTSISGTSIVGILKTVQTKILPHYSDKIRYGNTLSFSDTLINKYTSYSGSLTGNKVLLLLQVSLSDKSTNYDNNNNVESQFFFIVF